MLELIAEESQDVPESSQPKDIISKEYLKVFAAIMDFMDSESEDSDLMESDETILVSKPEEVSELVEVSEPELDFEPEEI